MPLTRTFNEAVDLEDFYDADRTLNHVDAHCSRGMSQRQSRIQAGLMSLSPNMRSS